MKAKSSAVPYPDHIKVHLPQLGFSGLESIGRRIELIGLEALVGEPDFEGLVIFLLTDSD